MPLRWPLPRPSQMEQYSDKPSSIKKRKNPALAAGPVQDEEGGAGGAMPGGIWEELSAVSVWTVAKYVMIIVSVCYSLHFVVTIGHVAYTQSKVVERYRQVAVDEMNQECCKIFYTNRVLFSVAPVGATEMVVVDEAESREKREQVKRCQRILAEEKNKGGINRCERSQDILGHSPVYQVLLEVWKQYSLFGDVSLLQAVVNAFLSLCTNSMSFMFFRKMMFQ